MTAPRPFRFGVMTGASGAAELTEVARKAEALGYALLATSDHLDLSGAHASKLAPISCLAAAAMVTTDLRLTTTVLNHDWRHPAVLAREIASLDILSQGRVEVGIGAGWNEEEYAWAGIRYDPVGVRIGRVSEYLQVLKGLLKGGPFSYGGEFFTIAEMPGEPRPVQRPHPPILCGGSGRRILGIAAREADIVNVLVITTPRMSAEDMDLRIGWVRDAASGRVGEIELSTMVAGVVSGRGSRVDAVSAAQAAGTSWGLQIAAGRLSPEEVVSSPAFLVGTPDQMAEDLLERRDRWGISHLVVSPGDIDAFAPVITRLAGR